MDIPTIFVLLLFSLIGVWAMVEPSGILQWIKRVHPNKRIDVVRAKSVIRFVGGWFITLSLLIFLTFLLHRT